QKQTQVVLERIAQNYLDYSQVRKQTKLRQGLQFVEKQLPFIQNRVDQIQKELQLFRQKYSFNDPETQVAQIALQTAEFSRQKQAIDLQLAEVRANFAILQGRNGATTILNYAPLYQQLIIQIRQLDVQIATESTRFQEDNPSMQTL
ncbi:MAG: GumC family protein, partial [Nostoc sp.]